MRIKEVYWRKKWQPTPVLLPGKFHGWRSLVGYSPWGDKESDMTEQLSLHLHFHMSVCMYMSVTQSFPTFHDPMDCRALGFPVLHHLGSLLKLMSFESVMPRNHLVLCLPLLHLPSIFPSIKVFSNELPLHIRWPKYWSFSFTFSSSNENSGQFPLGWTGWIS